MLNDGSLKVLNLVAEALPQLLPFLHLYRLGRNLGPRHEPEEVGVIHIL